MHTARAQEVMRKFREVDVGGRLCYAFTGSSPIAPEVLEFLRDALLVPFYEGYGSTEAGMVCSPTDYVYICIGITLLGVRHTCTFSRTTLYQIM